ncbi:MAG TPA: xanthine dehydrogenase family protein subunit M [Candidatus Binataceae bacterium]|nr:xanthine dehydrogenase family protein subunit M [Candidatus Binataceae bacterium]
MQEISYEVPTTVAQAVAMLKRHGEKARPFVGGTDLMIQMRAGVRRPDFVVDLKQIKELKQIKFDAKKGVRLGAAVSCIEIHESEVMRRHYPGLAEAAHLIGSLQIQNRASVGGNLCNGSPAADSTPALIALGAKARIAGGKTVREVPVEDFVTAPGRTVLKPNEILVEFAIPAPKPHSSDAYLRFIPRNEMDIAVVGVGTSITLDGEVVKAARIALGAVGPTPIFAKSAGDSLVGKTLDSAAIEAAAQLAIEAATPIDDMRGTAEFRKHVTGVLTRRTILIAAERARNKQ